MLKILLGNLLFAACVVGWYFHVDGDRTLALSGTILAFGCFLSGILMGYLFRGPGKARRTVYRGTQPFMTPVAEAEEQEEAEVETETEADEETIELEKAFEADQWKELELPVAVAAVARPPEIKIFEGVAPVIPEHPVLPVAEPEMAPVAKLEVVPPVEIHEPAMKVVVDSDGCYEMVIQGEPAPFIPADPSIIDSPVSQEHQMLNGDHKELNVGGAVNNER